jgi:natural resistance-associated macrophage protein
MTARLGIATGKDLARVAGDAYPRPARIALWLLLEVALVGADIQETIGSAIAIALLSGGAIPLWAGCLLITASAFLVLLLERCGARHLEAVFGGLIAMQGVSAGINFFQAGVPAKAVAAGLFIPRMPASAVPFAVGALGALVMPHNIYFASALVNTRSGGGAATGPLPKPPPGRARLLLRYARLETGVVLVGAFVINLFVVCLFAHGFYGTPAADSVGLSSAGAYLGDRFGVTFKYLWAVGLLASGQSATISLTYAGQIVMAGLLRFEVTGWKRMLGTRAVALIPTVTIAAVTNGSARFDGMNQILNVLQAMVLPFSLVPLIALTASPAVMPPDFVTRRAMLGFAGALAGLVAAIDGYLIVDWVREVLPDGASQAAAVAAWTAVGTLMVAYYLLIAYFAAGPARAAAAARWAARRARAGAAAVAAGAKGTRWRDPGAVLEVHI